MPGWSRSAAPWPPRGTAAAVAATSRTAIRAPRRIVELLAEANIVTDYRTPDRLRFGLSPLTTRYTDVWAAVAATRAIIETEHCESHG